MEAHETYEKIHEVAHHGHGGHEEEGGSRHNVRIAVMISVLACLLALVETGVKGSQSVHMAANIEASNLWAFFQAKSIRMTTVRAAAETAELLSLPGLSKEQAATMKDRIAKWNAEAQRYDSEPETGEGRKEIAAKAKAAEKRRDLAWSAYHMYEYAAAALQISIVLASAAVVSGVIALSYGAGGLGVIGAVFALIGWLAPTLIHF